MRAFHAQKPAPQTVAPAITPTTAILASSGFTYASLADDETTTMGSARWDTDWGISTPEGQR